MSDNKTIPLQRSRMGEEEVLATAEAVRSSHLIGDALICKHVEGQMRELLGVKHVLN